MQDKPYHIDPSYAAKRIRESTEAEQESWLEMLAFNVSPEEFKHISALCQKGAM